MILFFDTETTGLPRNWNAPVSDLRNWPRLVQLAWLEYRANGELLDSHSFIVKPDGFRIPPQASQVHGITNERALAEGVALDKVLRSFTQSVSRARVLVAHNINFDAKIVGAEFLRANLPNELFNRRHICTMKSTTDFCRIPGPYGYKWPTLSELYLTLFGRTFPEAHNAAADVEALAKCFFRLKELNVL